jgi:hypothetical protein
VQQGQQMQDQTNLFEKLHFTFELEAKESSLLKILDNLASNKMFVVITSLNISKTKSYIND